MAGATTTLTPTNGSGKPSDALDTERGTSGNRLFYLATPPEAFGPVIDGLAGVGLNHPGEGSFSRIVIEKPCTHEQRPVAGRPSARGLRRVTGVRIDHYLGKDTVQNLLALRFANAIFELIWNRSWVDHVQITVAGRLGVGTRGSFYEHAGATRDILQNHVLQVLALR